MKLKDKNASVVGGLYYIFKDKENREFRVNGYNDSWSHFLYNIKRKMEANNVEVPANLQDYVEDQICSRQPPGVCRYDKSLGDSIARGAHIFGKMIDKGAAAIGIESHVARNMATCSGCNKRREYLNIKGQKIADGARNLLTGNQRTHPKPK